MPELPEIEHLRRTLKPLLVGARVRSARLLRPDVLRSAAASGVGGGRRATGDCLLRGGHIEALARHGKELALIATDGRTLCVHLGMSGQLRFCPAGSRLPRRDHVHCVWVIESRQGPGRLVFRDPRRFGGLWAFNSFEELRAARWQRLGPDALTTGAASLRRALAGTRRPVKAALLDQRTLAGVGNIYADEALFAAGVHPRSIACRLDPVSCRRLALAIRSVLRCAIHFGGSTIRDYVDGQGAAGSFATRHCVYGRADEPCLRCGGLLRSELLSQRTTVFCPSCQPMGRLVEY